MLIRQGDERNDDVDRRLACALAAIAGAVNTAAFHAVGFFSANMTGNVSVLSDHLASLKLAAGTFFLLIVIVFIFGAFLSTLLINAGRRRHIRGIYAFSVLTEAVLLALLGCIELRLPDIYRSEVLIPSLSFLMGLQNATVTRISNARVRTTHVSGMATDIGIDLGALWDIARGAERPDDARQIRVRLRMHGQSVLSFLAGGVLGVIVYTAIGYQLLLWSAAVLFALAVPGLLRSRGRDP